MLYFSSFLQEAYGSYASNLFSALTTSGTPYQLLDGTKDIWLRDFMPVQTGSGKYVSFRYEPSYFSDNPEIRTDFRQDIMLQFDLPIIYSDINLDGGNVVFSPSKQLVIISDRIFSENPDRDTEELIRELTRLLEAEVIIIPSLKSQNDITGHADGMLRFLDEHTAIGNYVPSKNGLEQRIKRIVGRHGIDVIDFPYQSGKGISAVGTYLNFLDTESHIFLPIFGIEMDSTAVSSARQIFSKEVVPVNICGIAEEGGCLNCISWEQGTL